MFSDLISKTEFRHEKFSLRFTSNLSVQTNTKKVAVFFLKVGGDYGKVWYRGPVMLTFPFSTTACHGSFMVCVDQKRI